MTGLLLAHSLCLSDYGFDFKSRIRVSCNEIMSRMLQDANPTKPIHALCISTVVFNFLVRMGWTVVWQGLLQKKRGWRGGNTWVLIHKRLMEVVTCGAHWTSWELFLNFWFVQWRRWLGVCRDFRFGWQRFGKIVLSKIIIELQTPCSWAYSWRWLRFFIPSIQCWLRSNYWILKSSSVTSHTRITFLSINSRRYILRLLDFLIWIGASKPCPDTPKVGRCSRSLLSITLRCSILCLDWFNHLGRYVTARFWLEILNGIILKNLGISWRLIKFKFWKG